MILVHNHPSGDPEPSLADRNLTSKLQDALNLVGVRTPTISWWDKRAVFHWLNGATCKEMRMKLLIRTVASAFMFTGILAGCLAILLLVILMVRFPPLLIAVVLACWIYRKQKARATL